MKRKIKLICVIILILVECVGCKHVNENILSEGELQEFYTTNITGTSGQYGTLSCKNQTVYFYYDNKEELIRKLDDEDFKVKVQMQSDEYVSSVVATEQFLYYVMYNS
jgi:hypothetical protein